MICLCLPVLVDVVYRVVYKAGDFENNEFFIFPMKKKYHRNIITSKEERDGFMITITQIIWITLVTGTVRKSRQTTKSYFVKFK